MIPPTPASRQHAYSTEVEGGVPVAVRMDVRGVLGQSYFEFVAGRAAWLSLSGWIERPAIDRAVVVAAGPEALVGALEMACLLGPIDTLIDTVHLSAETSAVPAGFAVRR